MHNPDGTDKVLHVLGNLGRGGIETWLMHVFRKYDRTRFQMDVAVHTDIEAAHDQEARSLGIRIFHCPTPTSPLTYAKNLSKIINAYGPYQIVHSHANDYGGYILRIASRNGVPVRIAHSHSDRLLYRRPRGLLRWYTLPIQRFWIRKYATEKLGASTRAAIALFGRSSQFKGNEWRVLLYGIDTSLFISQQKSSCARKAAGIPHDAFVIGHVGRIDDQKNHSFVIDIFAEVAQEERNAYLVLIGDGPLRRQMQDKVKRLGLETRVMFLGPRDDVSQLMRDVMDVFLFPSIFEGLGLVLIEAQAAGLPCVYSDVVPIEADVVPALLHRESLDTSPADWARIVLDRRDNWFSRDKALSIVRQSGFNIDHSVGELEAIYSRGIEHAKG